MENKLRVWWNPQIGAVEESFYVPVESIEEAKKIIEILSAYDLYQLQSRIKGDFANTGGLQIYNTEVADYEDWWLETEDDYFEDIDDYISTTDNAEKIDDFTRKLFEQIDYNKIELMTQ